MLILSLTLFLADPAPPHPADNVPLDLASQTDSAEALIPVVERMSREIEWRPAPPKRERQFKVRESRTLEKNGRKITFNKVVPPVKAPVQEPVITSAPQVEPLETLEAPKAYASFNFSGVVYDKRVTELSWTHANTRYRVFIDADLSFLHSLSSVETETAHYSLIGILAHEESAHQPHWIPGKNYFSKSHVEYAVVEPTVAEPSGLDPEAFASLDALLDFYEVNKRELWLKYAQQQAGNEARKRQKAAEPPEEKDMVIHFWKKEGR